MRFHEEEEAPLPLVRRTFDEKAWHRSYRPARLDADLDAALDEEEEETHARRVRLGLYDRFTPASAGGITGFFGGAAALGIVHLLERPWIDAELVRAATQWHVPVEASFAVAYGTLAACGAILGGAFASVTKNLRKFVPLLLWSLVFFSSVAVVVLSTASAYGFGWTPRVAPAVFAATATFAVLAAMSLPLRRRNS